MFYFLGVLMGCPCNLCPKWFASLKTLSRHKMWHHKSSSQQYRFNCTQCPYSSNKKTNFDSHLVVHRLDRSHLCPYCGNGFTSSSSLNKHIIIHTGEDNHGFNISWTMWGHFEVPVISHDFIVGSNRNVENVLID